MSTVSDSELAIIQSISSFYAPLYKFAYFASEDIAQEVSVMCLEALPRYDPSKNATLMGFLIHHVRNRLYNLRRDKFTRPLACSKNKESCCKYLELGGCEPCEVYQRWYERNMVKRQLAQNLGIRDAEILDNERDDMLIDLDKALKNLDDDAKRLWLKYRSGIELDTNEMEQLTEDVLVSLHL